MEISSRTTEGLPNECPICGKQVWIVPSVPPDDATCPHCGSTIWFPDATNAIPDVLHQLQNRGAVVETDDEGQVCPIRLIGAIYTDAIIDQLAKLQGVRVIDVSRARFTSAGVARMRDLKPETKITTEPNERDRVNL